MVEIEICENPLPLFGCSCAATTHSRSDCTTAVCQHVLVSPFLSKSIPHRLTLPVARSWSAAVLAVQMLCFGDSLG